MTNLMNKEQCSRCRNDKYILVGEKVKPVEDPSEWMIRMRRVNKNVGYDTIKNIRISTVFLGLDHRFGEGPPLLFETMCFPGEEWREIYCKRYSTLQEAREGHAKVVEMVKKCIRSILSDLRAAFPEFRFNFNEEMDDAIQVKEKQRENKNQEET